MNLETIASEIDGLERRVAMSEGGNSLSAEKAAVRELLAMLAKMVRALAIGGGE